MKESIFDRIRRGRANCRSQTKAGSIPSSFGTLEARLCCAREKANTIGRRNLKFSWGRSPRIVYLQKGELKTIGWKSESRKN